MTESWIVRATCRHCPDLFFDKSSQKQAVHLCRYHCPVAVECSVAAARRHQVSVVIAGRAYSEKGELLEKLGGDGNVVAHNAYCRALPLGGD